MRRELSLLSSEFLSGKAIPRSLFGILGFCILKQFSLFFLGLCGGVKVGVNVGFFSNIRLLLLQHVNFVVKALQKYPITCTCISKMVLTVPHESFFKCQFVTG